LTNFEPHSNPLNLIINKCIVCGKAWTNAQSLRAHMKSHHHQGYVRTAIMVNGDAWKEFRTMCTNHNTTTCHVLGALIDAALVGEKQGIITVGQPNPTLIQVNHYFSGRPRSLYKSEVPWSAALGTKCMVCGSGKIETHVPESTKMTEGHCQACGAEWLISPPPASKIRRDGGDAP